VVILLTNIKNGFSTFAETSHLLRVSTEPKVYIPLLYSQDMSDSFPAGAVPLSILAGVSWVVQPAAVFPLFEALLGDASLGLGFIFAVIFGHGARNFLLSILVISVFWMVFRDPRSLWEFDRPIRVAAVAGVVFLLLLSPVSDVFSGFLPRGETPIAFRSIRVAGSICAAVLIGSVLVSTLRSVRSRYTSA
jgi:hypothetical protein